MLDLLSRFRNVCAHNERLFDYKYQKGNIPDTYIHRHMGVLVKKSAYASGKSDLFAVLICLKYLLNTESFNNMIDEIDSCINELFKKTHQIQMEQMLKYTGFTSNWRELKECPFTVRLNRQI